MSCQEVLDNTADDSRREAVAKLAEAFSDLEAADPEGMYAIMSGIFTRVKEDSKLLTLVPALAKLTQSTNVPGSRISSVASTASTAASTSPRKEREPFRAPGSRLNTPLTSPVKASGPKLVMAQNNPHLKSHHRRQSTQSHLSSSRCTTPTSPAPSRSPSKAVPPSPSHNRSPSKISAVTKEEVLKRRNSRLESASPTKAGRDRGDRAEREKERREKEKEAAERLKAEIEAVKVGGQMEHTKALAEGMFGRWCEGVAVRWAGVQ